MRFRSFRCAWPAVLVAAVFLGGHCLSAYAQETPAAAPGPAASAAGTSSLPKQIPVRRDVPGAADGPPWTALLVLLVLAGGAAVFVLRRRGATGLLQAWQGQRGAGAIERVASQALTAHGSVHAVRWHGEELLLGCTASQVTLLSRRPSDGGGPAS